MSKLAQLLETGKPILLDGAMGTMLMNAGLESGDAPEEWNLTQPEKILQVHQEYIQAGSQIILTNSFGGTRLRLALHNLEERAGEFNLAAARIARQAADKSDRPVMVAGSIGPSGQIFEPMGTLTYEEAVSAFEEQAEALAKGGVDLFWIETMSDLDEVNAALEGIRRVSQLPVAATMSFDTHGHTMMGVKPETALAALRDLGLELIGANCGTGSDELIEAVQAMQSAGSKGVQLIAKANAGIPQVQEGQVVYNGSPEVMADYAIKVHQAGARLIGGCCGNTPVHIQAMSEALEGI